MADIPAIITPSQCRAARGLIDMRQTTLADLSDLSTVALNQFEGGKRLLKPEHRLAIRAALECEGVIFLDSEGTNQGVGVRLQSKVKLRSARLR